MITTFYPPHSFGGDAVFVQALSRLLAERGHTVDVVHCMDSFHALGGDRSVAVAAHEHPSVTVHGLSSPFGWLSPLATQQTGYPLFKAAGIRRILDAGNFDVIHFHNVSLVGGPALLGYGSGLKLYTIHEHWLLCPMHTLFRNNRQPCEEKKCVRCALHFDRPPQLWRYTNALRNAVPEVDAFLAPTDFTRDLHLASGLPMRILTLPHFHDPRPSIDTQDPPLKVPALNRPFFLYAGRLERLKGIQRLIPVFANYPGADLVIAGGGSQDPALRDQARGLANVVFLGQVTRASLADLYGRAIAVLVPSLAMEVFPLVILEAFAARTPVIARAHGPLPEILTASGGGALFRDESELPDLLQWFQSHPDERNRMGEAGFRKWRAEWTPEAHMKNYLSLIDQLTASK